MDDFAHCEADQRLVESWLFGRPESTQKTYRREARRMLRYVKRPLAEITLRDLQAWATTLSEYADATRARKISAVRSLFAFAAEQGHTGADVAASLRSPKVKDDLAERILSEAEVQRLIHAGCAPGSRAQVIIQTLYAAALRVSELVSLRWADLSESGDAGQLTIHGKGGKTRVVLLSAAGWELLGRWRTHEKAGEKRLFPWTKRTVQRIVSRAAGRAGLEHADGSSKDVSPHWLRHAHISHALDRGAPSHLVRDTAGHASLATTSRYAHARPEDSSSRYLAL